jgi:hypothetical protein
MTDVKFTSRLPTPKHYLLCRDYGNKLSRIKLSKPPFSCYVYPSTVLYSLRTPSRITITFVAKLAGGKRFRLVDSEKRGDVAGFNGRQGRKALLFTRLVSFAWM